MRVYCALHHVIVEIGFPGGSDDKVPKCNAEDPGSILEVGRSPGEGNGNSLQYSCLENPMDRGALRATVLGVGKDSDDLKDGTQEEKEAAEAEMVR